MVLTLIVNIVYLFVDWEDQPCFFIGSKCIDTEPVILIASFILNIITAGVSIVAPLLIIKVICLTIICIPRAKFIL